MTEINLEPPTPEPTNMDMLATWGITPTWDKEHKIWHIPGLGYLNEIAELDEEESKYLTSRDRHAVEKIIEDLGDHLGFCYLDQDVWEPVLGWYSRGDNRAGPSIDVKLHDTWDAWRTMEKIFDMDLDESTVDPDYFTWRDTIDWEFDWFKDEYIEGTASGFNYLSGPKFVLGGRSGGHLVYELDEHGALTLGEATELRKVWEDVPEMVKGVAQDIVVKQWAWYFEGTLWDEAVDEWREREEDAKAEAVRANDLQAARRHQANLDADIDKYKPDYMFDELWEMFYAATSKEE